MPFLQPRKREIDVQYQVFGFVDGGFIREIAHKHNDDYYNPLVLVVKVIDNAIEYRIRKQARIARVTYYDASPDEPQDTTDKIRRYWDAVERLDDTHLGFGYLRGKKAQPRQKAVDTLIAVDMLVGAFTQIYTYAILITKDADYIPVIQEVQRRGCTVVLASTVDAPDYLIGVADRFVELQHNNEQSFFSPLLVPS